MNEKFLKILRPHASVFWVCVLHVYIQLSCLVQRSSAWLHINFKDFAIHTHTETGRQATQSEESARGSVGADALQKLEDC